MRQWGGGRHHGLKAPNKPLSLEAVTCPQKSARFSHGSHRQTAAASRRQKAARQQGQAQDPSDLASPPGIPDMPARLLPDPVAVEKWRELVPILQSLGTLTMSDGEALATLCEVFSSAQQCLLAFRAGGAVMHTDLGGVKPNPAGPLYRGLVALQSTLMSEFGLTPSSRARIGGKETKPTDEVEEFFKIHGA
jgi:P27 family predicted phage terminase small subunit